jgi:transposase
VAIVALTLPLVCATATAPPAAPAGRFQAPPWDRSCPDWQRIDQKLPADHRARRIDRAVAALDLTALFAAYRGTGSLAHRPDLLLKVALYEVQRGRLSPAQWHDDLLTDEACQWLACGLRPSRSRLYALRDRLGPLLDRLHNGLLTAAVAEGLTDAAQASLDGTAVAANASRHRLLNAKTLAQRTAALQAAVQADAADAVPAASSPAATRPAWMAATPTGRRAQQARYACAEQQLDARRAGNQERPASKRLADQDVRIGVADPEAALGLDKFKVFRPLYTVQLLPDLNSPLVLAYEVFAQAGDAATLPVMLQRVRQATGRCPSDLLTDTAYAKALELAACARAGVTLYAPVGAAAPARRRAAKKPPKQIPKSAFVWREAEQAYVCPQGHRLTYCNAEYEKRGDERLRMLAYRCDPVHCSACPRQQECTRSPLRGRMVKRSEYEHLVEALQERMQTAQAQALYKRRCQTVELSFADQKQHRGLRQFRGRGLARARSEVGLVVLAHNALAVLALREKKEDPQRTRNSPPSSA